MEQGITVKALEVKAAIKSALDESQLPPKALADLMGIAYSTLCAYADPSTDLYMPSHRFPLFLTLTPKSHGLVRYLASLQGAVVVPLPKAGEGDRCKLPDAIAAMADFLQQHADASEDGRWTEDEAHAYDTLALHLHTCIAAEVLHKERAAKVSAISARRSA